MSFGLAVVSCGAVRAEDVGRGFEVDQYDVALRPDLQTTAVSGRQTILVTATSEVVSEFVFSANSLALSNIRIDGSAAYIRATPESLAFVLGAPAKPGQTYEITFDFSGFPARGITAIPQGIYTGYFACDWMVCLQDKPGDKAAISIDLYLPQGVRSLGVGRLEGERSAGSGLDVHRWRSIAETSPYVFAFAAGTFPQAVASSAAGDLRFYDGTGQGVDLEAAFASSTGIAEFLARAAGSGLPGGTYSQLLVPGREAQETMSFSLIGRGELDRETEDPSAAWVVAHEMAHQWWGNLVTCATWQDFWLNEGFATFMVGAWKQQRFGQDAYLRELAGWKGRRDQLIERDWDRPLAWAGTYPSLGIRRAVQYSKGALFLAHLRDTLGEEAFWTGVRTYTRDNAGGTVTSRDLQQAMERASGRDLSAVFAQWVYGSGKA